MPEQRAERLCGGGMGTLEMAMVVFIPAGCQWALTSLAQSNDVDIMDITWHDLVVLGIILQVGVAMVGSAVVELSWGR